MELISLLQSNLTLALFVFGFVGLCVGSFLNVVIHRMPLQMFYEWRKECPKILANQEDIGYEMMADVQAIVDKDQPITLSYPPSRCPNCGHQIRWYENIPVISWLILGGKCSSCKISISFRYPLVEILTAILSAFVIYKYGVNIAGISGMILIWILIALSGIDFDTQLLPDRLTFPLASLGLLINTFSTFTSPVMAIWGLVGGYLALWIVTKIFEAYIRFVKKIDIDAMGVGDFKLLAVLGAWFGATQLPLMILLSSLLGCIAGGYLFWKNNWQSKPFPLGPYIAIAGIVTLFYGVEITSWYLNTV